MYCERSKFASSIGFGRIFSSSVVTALSLALVRRQCFQHIHISFAQSYSFCVLINLICFWVTGLCSALQKSITENSGDLSMIFFHLFLLKVMKKVRSFSSFFCKNIFCNIKVTCTSWNTERKRRPCFYLKDLSLWCSKDICRILTKKYIFFFCQKIVLEKKSYLLTCSPFLAQFIIYEDKFRESQKTLRWIQAQGRCVTLSGLYRLSFS